MRDYGKVPSSFWTSKTGRAIRGDKDAQIVAFYLMTTQHANMIGVFYCPVLYIANETGSPIEGASKGLRRLEEIGFCTFDEDTELIWVHDAARWQIAEVLQTSDKRVKNIQKHYENLPECRIKAGFYSEYRTAFHIKEHKPHGSPFEAPSKPVSVSVSVAETVAGAVAVGDAEEAPSDENGKRLPKNWVLPKAWGEWALNEKPNWTADHVRKIAEKFRDYFVAKVGKDAKKNDWYATWRLWVRNEPDAPESTQRKTGNKQRSLEQQNAEIAKLWAEKQIQSEPEEVRHE